MYIDRSFSLSNFTSHSYMICLYSSVLLFLVSHDFEKEKLWSTDFILTFEGYWFKYISMLYVFLLIYIEIPTDWIQENCISPEISDQICCCFSRSTRFFGMYSALNYINTLVEVLIVAFFILFNLITAMIWGNSYHYWSNPLLYIHLKHYVLAPKIRIAGIMEYWLYCFSCRLAP